MSVKDIHQGNISVIDFGKTRKKSLRKISEIIETLRTPSGKHRKHPVSARHYDDR